MTLTPALQRLLGSTLMAMAGVGALVLTLGVGWLAPHRPVYALLVGVCILGLGISLVEPAAIPFLGVALFLVSERVGGGGVDLTTSDAVLFVAAWPAFLFAHRPFSPPMRALLWLTTAYLALTAFALLVHPYRANVIEWFHELFLVAGGLGVGWAVARRGWARAALLVLLAWGAVIAVCTIGEGLYQVAHNNFGPVYPRYPFPQHKNTAGTILGMLAVVAYARPPWLRVRRGPALTIFWLLSVGLLFTQSRQALVGLAVGLAVLVLRGPSAHRRSRLVLLATIPSVIVVWYLVRNQLASDNLHNSAFQRLDWFGASLRVWHTSPWFGVGNRWWYDGRFQDHFQPPNAVLEQLTTTGLVGLVGLVILLVGAILVIYRVPFVWGSLGVAVLVSRVVQGQLDLFWVSVLASLPWLIVGICLGAQAYAGDLERDAALARLTASPKAAQLAPGAA